MNSGWDGGTISRSEIDVTRLFVSQAQLDKWTGDGKVRIEGDVMLLPALGRRFRLETAVHVTRLVEGEDRLELIGRVKTSGQLATLGAEHYGTSVIIGEVAYECMEGFVGIPSESADVSLHGWEH
jgi:hypothetical protein